MRLDEIRKNGFRVLGFGNLNTLNPNPKRASQVLSLVPTAPTHLLPLLVQLMPHKLRDRDTQCLYLSAVYRVAEAPTGAPIRWVLGLLGSSGFRGFRVSLF